jgi:hypothetical protein
MLIRIFESMNNKSKVSILQQVILKMHESYN